MRLGRRRLGRVDGEFPGFADVVEIGSGGFSTVYRALEVATERPVALKLLRLSPQLSTHALESFRRETLALGALSAHPHIVTLYRSFTTTSGRPVLVLELCRGSMAGRLASEGALPPEEAVSAAIRLAGALDTAHEAGMLHRDVKPQNVLVTSFGEPALADFGVARLQASAELATGGAFAFTTLHAPPELLEGHPASPATDVYELASTLYQLLSGKPAFHAFEDEAPAAAALRILRDPVPPLVVAGVPLALSDVLVAAMAKDPADRPASAAELAAQLQAVASAARWAPTRVITMQPAGLGTGAGIGALLPATGPEPLAASEDGAAVRARGAALTALPAPPAGAPCDAEATIERAPLAGRVARPPARRPASLVAPPQGRRQVLTPVPRAQGRPTSLQPAPGVPPVPRQAPGDAGAAPGSGYRAPAPAPAPVTVPAPGPPHASPLEETRLRPGEQRAEEAAEAEPSAGRRLGAWRRRRSEPS